MSKFWVLVGAVLIIGLFAAFLPTETSEIKINDLETECRGDRGTSTNIALEKDDSLRFEGYFPVQNTKSDLSFNYDGGEDILLNVKSQDLPAPEFLWDDCLASVVYDLQTAPLEEGTYVVEIRHNGERVEKRSIRIRN